MPDVIATHTGAPLGDRQPDRQVAGGALVDADVQPDPAGAVGVVQREGQRRVARPGHSTTSRTPPRMSSSTTTRACAVDGFTTTAYAAKNSSAAAFTTCGFSMKPRCPASGISR